MQSTNSNTMVILVDENDNQVGLMEKLEAHKKGLLHRAFSVFVFNSKNELLLQQRAFNKYHSGGLWTNTCCSHPYPKEDIKNAADRRLKEEMKMSCELNEVFSFTYNIALENDLTEHELDHVFIGYSDALPEPDPTEVHDWKYITMDALAADMQLNPQKYTVWLKYCFQRILSYQQTNNKSGS